MYLLVSHCPGTVTIEMWGAGGSGAKMCCCGNGLPGNSGSYSKRTITMGTSNYIYGCVGFACGNPVTHYALEVVPNHNALLV